MKFIITRDLSEGKYYIRVVLAEFSDTDTKKASKFGMPKLAIRYNNGNNYTIPINVLHQSPLFGFPTQAAANVYASDLKTQIENLKKRWADLEDNWSGQEEL